MYDVITIGDVMRDIFVFPSIDEMEKPIEKNGENFLIFQHGDKITLDDIHYDIGGTAGNVAVGLAKLGLKTGIISCIGKDNEGAEILEALKKSKVNVDNLEISRQKKTSFSVIISYIGERTILVFQSFKPEDFNIPTDLATDWVYIGPLGKSYRSLYSKVTALAAEKNAKIALNPGSVQIIDGLASFTGLLRVAKILFVNREEGQKLAKISGVATVRDITRVLLKTGVEMVAVTDGKEGAYVATVDEFFKIGVYPGTRIEATGAGDAFAAGFLAANSQGEKLMDCLRWGVVNAAAVIEKVGAQEGLQNSTTIKRKIRDYNWPAAGLRFS